MHLSEPIAVSLPPKSDVQEIYKSVPKSYPHQELHWGVLDVNRAIENCLSLTAKNPFHKGCSETVRPQSRSHHGPCPEPGDA